MKTGSIRQGTMWGNALVAALLVIVFVVAAFPFYYVLIVSVMPYENYLSSSRFLPNGFTLYYITQALSDTYISFSYLNSFLRTGIGGVLSVLLTTVAAYVLTKQKLKLYKPLNMFILIPMFFSGGMVPLYLTIKNLRLIDTFVGLIIPFLLTPYFLVLMKNFMWTIPREMEESAHIDGANALQSFVYIVLPLVKPGLAVIGVLYSTGYWNEFFWSGILVNNPRLYTLTVALRNIYARTMITTRFSPEAVASTSMISAVVLMIIIPVLIMYPLIQKYFTQGLLIGAVKG